MKRKITYFFVLISLLIAPSALAADLTYSAWIPYWRETGGTAEATAHLDKLSDISPFSYTVDQNGLLVDKMGMGTEPWLSLMAAARKQEVKILPSILWTDSMAIDQTLRATSSRQAHEKMILDLVASSSFDGIDIDYENKYASTSPYFSAFLKELGTSLRAQGKQLSCTIEARTPPESKYLTVPETLEYANDYQAINKYCDQVRLMAYDQGTADIKLNMIRRLGSFYYPIADPAWVMKVLDLAIKDIAPSKIVLGVATYGYELEVTDKIKYFDYKMIRSLNYQDLLTLASANKQTLQRDNAGELALTYVATSTGAMRFATFSDSQALAAKVRIAKMYGLKGVAVFKLDGEGDPSNWNYLQ